MGAAGGPAERRIGRPERLFVRYCESRSRPRPMRDRSGATHAPIASRSGARGKACDSKSWSWRWRIALNLESRLKKAEPWQQATRWVGQVPSLDWARAKAHRGPVRSSPKHASGADRGEHLQLHINCRLLLLLCQGLEVDDPAKATRIGRSVGGLPSASCVDCGQQAVCRAPIPIPCDACVRHATRGAHGGRVGKAQSAHTKSLAYKRSRTPSGRDVTRTG